MKGGSNLLGLHAKGGVQLWPTSWAKKGGLHTPAPPPPDPLLVMHVREDTHHLCYRNRYGHGSHSISECMHLQPPVLVHTPVRSTCFISSNIGRCASTAPRGGECGGGGRGWRGGGVLPVMDSINIRTYLTAVLIYSMSEHLAPTLMVT